MVTTLFPLVGIGSSAGGVEALTTLLQGMPADIGSAFIIIQHLDPSHDSALPEILGRHTRMPVLLAMEGMRVEPNRVYVIPPNVLMRLEGHILKLAPRLEGSVVHMPIDHFFRSLARDHASMAMGIILSGTGSDGTLGVAEIKGNGGITFAQDEKTAQFSGMPSSAAAGGAVDFILPVEDMAKELSRIANHPYVTSSFFTDAGENAPSIPGERDHLSQIFRSLRAAMGVDFSQYKKSTIMRRISRRMTLRKLDRLEDYAADLKGNPGEVQALYRDLLIKVTGFFRDPATFEALKSLVIPAIVRARAKDEERPIRVWVPGCASGEEVYSIAICFLEVMGSLAIEAPLRIFATDVDEGALQTARMGSYADSIGADVSPERLSSFFTKSGNTYQIKKAIRESCTFSRHDLGRDPPFSSLDLISCRNLMIYFDAPLQKRILPVFHFALKPKAFLTFGISENIGSLTGAFELIDKKQKIYVKGGGPAHMNPPEFSAPPPSLERVDPLRPLVNLEDVSWKEPDIYKESDRILLNHYGPAGVLINEQMEILQFRGDTSRYLVPFPGKASFNLLKMVREGLLTGVRASVDQARKSGLSVSREGLRVRNGGTTSNVTLRVIPMRFSGKARHFMILFEDPAPSRKMGDKKATRAQREASEKFDLRQELATTKEYLQSTIEGQEIAHEELKAANEEILSSNEELQSSNEELETSKEELQSINEELQSAKEELQSTNEELRTLNEGMRLKNVELLQANDDLNNVFSSASLPVLLVDKNLRIRRFTGFLEPLLNITSADVGRPLKDLHFTLNLPTVEPLLSEVIAQGTFREQEVQDLRGHWYSVRIQPYKTEEGHVEGAVIYFIDIDSLKGVERLTKSLEALQAARNHSEGIVQSIREPFLELDADLRVTSANPAFYRAFQAGKEETEGCSIFSLGEGEWQIPDLRTALDQALSIGSDLENMEVERDFPRIGRRVVLLNAKRFILGSTGMKMVLLTIEDVTERRRSEMQVKSALSEKEILLKEIHHRVKNNLQIISSLLKLRYDVVDDGLTRNFIRESLDRIQTIALVHERLYNTESLAHINMEDYIKSLVGPLIQSYGIAEKISWTVNVNAQECFLSPDTAIPCGLIINELISNAIKYAFPKERPGCLLVDFRLDPGPEVFLGVKDDGVGLPAGMDISKATTLGLRLVRQLVSQLGGRFDSQSSAAGTAFSIRFPFRPEGEEGGGI